MGEADLRPDDLFSAYKTLRTMFPHRGRLAKFQQTCLRATPRTIIDVAAAEREVAALEEDKVGWCRRASWVGRTPFVEPRRNPGPPLDGEWCLDQVTSARLFYDGQGWHLLTLTELGESAASEVRENAVPVLREEVVIAANPAKLRQCAAIHYAVYWCIPPDGAVHRLACRLLGFEEANQ